MLSCNISNYLIKPQSERYIILGDIGQQLTLETELINMLMNRLTFRSRKFTSPLGTDSHLRVEMIKWKC